MSSDDSEIECVKEVRASHSNLKKKAAASTKTAYSRKKKEYEEEADESAEIVDDSSESSEPDEADSSAKSSSALDESKSSQNEEPVPSGAECLTRCAQFAEITGTDKALAMFYLQDTNWNLEKALDEYYKTTSKNPQSKIVACFDVGKLNKDEKTSERKRASKGSKASRQSSSENQSDDDDSSSAESSPKRSKSKQKASEPTSPTEEQLELMKNEIAFHQEQKQQETQEEESKHFKIMSWNIDGLDKANLGSRTLGVASTIMKERPDVVMLQEVVVESQAILMRELSKLYDNCTGNKMDYLDMSDPSESMLRRELQKSQDKSYYTMILAKKSTCKMFAPDLIDFGNSVMTRNLLKVKLKYRGMIEFYAMTAHLESTKEFSKQRIEQLKICFDEMAKSTAGDSIPVFFGGDLNLRDTELSAIGGLPSNIHDAWEATGSRKECLYTWDQMRNDNLRMNGKFKPRCRFDRLYYKPASKKASSAPAYTLMPVYFELEGLTKLKSCGRFSSDHWAIQTYCQIEELKC